MKRFDGFPARTEYTPLPSVFFSRLLPQIDDIAELKTTLYVIAALYRKKGHPRCVGFGELLGNVALMSGLTGGSEAPEAGLRRALEAAVARGTLLRVSLAGSGGPEDIYLLNTEADRQAAAKIESGELEVNGRGAVPSPYVPAGETPDIFKLYEENIGLLTPMVADELRDAEKTYPPEWIRDAIREAVNHNKRRWAYVTAILEHWSAEGRSDGAYQRDTKKADPDKYFRGKYGHMVQQ